MMHDIPEKTTATNKTWLKKMQAHCKASGLEIVDTDGKGNWWITTADGIDLVSTKRRTTAVAFVHGWNARAKHG